MVGIIMLLLSNLQRLENRNVCLSTICLKWYAFSQSALKYLIIWSIKFADNRVITNAAKGF